MAKATAPRERSWLTVNHFACAKGGTSCYALEKPLRVDGEVLWVICEYSQFLTDKERRQEKATCSGGSVGGARPGGTRGTRWRRPLRRHPPWHSSKGSNVGCTVTWSGHSIGAIGSYEAFTFTSTPASSPSSVGPANAAHGVHPGATVTSVEHLTPGTMSASLVFHAVNNYGQQQTINLTIPTPGC